MSERPREPFELPPLHPADELPLHPTIRRWLRAYVEARQGQRDAVVAAILRDWNVMLVQAPSQGGLR
jgi:hypothetical protein